MTDTVSPTTPRKSAPSVDQIVVNSPTTRKSVDHSSDQEVDYSDDDDADSEDKLDDLLLLASDDEEEKAVDNRPKLYSSIGAMSMDQLRRDTPPASTTSEPVVEKTIVEFERDDPVQEEVVIQHEIVIQHEEPEIIEAPVVKPPELPKKPVVQVVIEEEEESMLESSNDVGEVLRYNSMLYINIYMIRRMMEEEDKKLMKEWDQQEKARELLAELEFADKNKINSIDWSKELQIESRFYIHVTKKLKHEYIAEMTTK
jgi:hypothetical protein